MKNTSGSVSALTIRKYLATIAAALLCACCLGLAACGGSASSSAASSASGSSASASTSSASAASASAASSSAATASSAATTSASAAASDEVSPELKTLTEQYSVVCDELVAVVDKAKEAGSYDAVKDEWQAVSAKLDTLSKEAQTWATKYANGELSAADKQYYDNVMIPIATKALNAASDMLGLIK